VPDLDLFGEPLDETAAAWRSALFETVEPLAKAKLPLLLSGGVDSGTLLCALVALGHRPACYGYRLSKTHSVDYAYAKRMAISLGCPWRWVIIEETPEVAEEEAREVIRLLRTSRKTSVQCAGPIMRLTKLAATEGHERAIVGTGAVVLDDRRVMEILAREGEEGAREYRRMKLDDRYTDCGTGRMHEIARLMGVPLEEPYSDEPLRSHALALDVRELNRGPRGYGQKGIAVRAFPKFWIHEPPRYRRNSPLQVNSGLREWHDTLLEVPHLNPMGAKRVVAIYGRMLREQENPTLD
jgi:asparagine synthetase B (glutamine-hydrolysing)